jgi:ribonucleoside-diphosphate reductase alpha chain
MQMVNEAGRHIMQGGARRSAIWAGLRWSHPDVMKFIALKNWSPEVRALKEKDFNFPATLDGTNISVILDKDFFVELEQGTARPDSRSPAEKRAHDVYWTVVRSMLETGEPGFSIDYNNSRESLRNACTEVVSEDDSDICNLGSLNLARFDSLNEFARAVELGTVFLLAGTLYSHVPYAQVDDIRTKNRRLGLGLMGIHEWLLKRGKPYGPDEELGKWLEVYREVSGRVARETADAWGISRPIATRAIAPTGTIGIVAETTTGIEPIFCVAYKRRYKGRDGLSTQFQYVVDPAAKRLIDSGHDATGIEDAYSLAREPERRIAFQAWLQQYVDMSISSTLNLPAWGTSLNNETLVQPFGEMLLKYLPQLRGITVYPDGARGGQPLVPCTYAETIGNEGRVFVEGTDICSITNRGASCGS